MVIVVVFCFVVVYCNIHWPTTAGAVSSARNHDGKKTEKKNNLNELMQEEEEIFKMLIYQHIRTSPNIALDYAVWSQTA